MYRKDHNHFETPGGKVKTSECANPLNPTINELSKAARRELFEELGENIQISKLEYFGCVEFKIPDGRLAVANKFITQIISGKPVINEPDLFSELEYIPIKDLDKYPVSKDLKLFLSRLKKK